MKPFPLNLKHFKKIKTDLHSSVLKHKDGHEIRIAHASLKPELKKQLNDLPHYAEGGDVDQVDSDQVVHIDPSTLPGFAPKQAESVPMVNPEFQSQQPAIPAAAIKKPQITQAAPNFNQLTQSQLDALKKQQLGETLQAQALSTGAQQSQKLMEPENQAYQDQLKKIQGDHDYLTNERQNLQNAISNGQIDPDRYLKNLSVGNRITNAIGLILGGFGAGLTHGPNLAYNMLEKEIDNDIMAQRADLGKKENLLSHNLQALGDNRAAQDLLRLQHNDVISNYLKQGALTTQNLQGKGLALSLAGKIDSESSQLQQQMAIRGMALGAGAPGSAKQPAQLQPEDPSGYVSTMVPKEHQAQVFKEIDAAQDTKRMAKAIIDSFDKAAEENTIMRTGAGLLRTPASVYALHQAMQPTFKDLEGTVRQAAMDNTFKNITPMPGDKEYTVQTKRQALLDYLQSKASASTAKGYGIDLHRFESTAPYREQKSLLEGQQGNVPGIGRVVMRNGKLYKAQ